MRTVLKQRTQTELIEAVAEWQKSNVIGEYNIFIESIKFFPYYKGNVSALIIYRKRKAEDANYEPITLHEPKQYYGSCSSERAIFSAMQGGTDSG